MLEVGYVGTHTVHLRETRTDIEAQTRHRCQSTYLDRCGRHAVHHHREHDRQRPGALQQRRHQRLQRHADFCRRRLLALPLAANHRFAPLERRILPGGLHVLARPPTPPPAATPRSTPPSTTKARWPIRAGSRTSTARTASSSATATICRSSRARPDVKRAALGDWAISGITIFQSGTPFSVLDSSAGTAYLGGGLQGGTAGAELARLFHQRRSDQRQHSRPRQQRLPESRQLHHCASRRSRGLRARSQRLRHRLRQSRPQHLSWSLPAELGLLADQEFQVRRAPEHLRFTTDFFNIWNHANFANPAVTDVENPGAFGQNLLDRRHPAPDPILPALRLLIQAHRDQFEPGAQRCVPMLSELRKCATLRAFSATNSAIMLFATQPRSKRSCPRNRPRRPMSTNPRIPLLERDAVSPEAVALYDALLAQRGVVPNMFKVLSYNSGDRPRRSRLPEAAAQRRRPPRLVQGTRRRPHLPPDGFRIRHHAPTTPPRSKKGATEQQIAGVADFENGPLQRKRKTRLPPRRPSAPRPAKRRRRLLHRTEIRLQRQGTRRTLPDRRRLRNVSPLHRRPAHSGHSACPPQNDRILRRTDHDVESHPAFHN